MASKAVTSSSANITVNVSYSLAPLSLSGFQNAVAKDLQTLIMNEITTNDETAQVIRGAVQVDIMPYYMYGSNLPDYVSNPNGVGDSDHYFYELASYSRAYTTSNAQTIANRLYQFYMNEKTGYQIVANESGKSDVNDFIIPDVTVNGITYSYGGTSGTNPRRVGFYNQLTNHYLSGKVYVNIAVSSDMAYAELCIH